MNLSTLLQNPVILNEIVNTLKANPQLTLQLLESAAPALMNHLEMPEKPCTKEPPKINNYSFPKTWDLLLDS